MDEPLSSTSVRGAGRTTSSPADTRALSLEEVHFRWPESSVDTLSIPRFSMDKGERVFISGPSGSGKSTLLALIAGILVPGSGAVHVNGYELSRMSSAERDRFRGDHIGFIFQQFNLIPYLSIIENVLIPCHFSPLRYERARKNGTSLAQAATTLLERLDLSPSLWKTAVRRLSIGQQQRVAAARALIGQPELIIADEPTSALDADRRAAFLQLLLEECSSCGSSLLFVSHEEALSTLFPRIVAMSELTPKQACA